MCKTATSQHRAFENFRDKIRGENATNCKAIYEDRDVPNLIGFFAVLDHTIANFFEVQPDDSVRVTEFIPCYCKSWGNRGVAMHFGADYAVSI